MGLRGGMGIDLGCAGYNFIGDLSSATLMMSLLACVDGLVEEVELCMCVQNGWLSLSTIVCVEVRL